MGVCNSNCDNNLSAINLDDLNEKYVKLPMPVINSDYYEYFTSPFGVNFMCISELDVIEHFIKIKSNAIGVDEIHPMFVKALLPKLLPHFC